MLLAILLLVTGWEKTGSEASVEVYRREVPGSAFLAVKGTGIVEAPVRTVALVLLDDARAREWVDSLAEARVVRTLSEVEYIEYNRASMPLVVIIRSIPVQDTAAPFVVNFFQKDWARETIQGIRKQCAKPDLRAPKEFVVFLESLKAWGP
jgi:hypothetical protein